MKVHATINVYNDHVMLPIGLASIKNHVDTIIVADGAYQLYYENYVKHHPETKPWSTDGTLEILKAIPDLPPIQLIECPDGKPWRNQCVKRTALLDAVPEGDWFIILDTDEMLWGDIERGLLKIMASGCIAGQTPLYNPGLDASMMKPFWHPRIFLKIDGMHYSRKHWLLRDYAGRVVEFDYPVVWTDAFVFAHLKAFKEEGRAAPHYGYMEMMSEAGWIEPHSAPFNLNPVRREVLDPVPRKFVDF